MRCAEPEKAENATEKGKEVFMGGLPQIILFAGILSLGGMLANLGRSDVQEISFQHFKTHLLAQGLVEKVEVANKTSAKVYVRAGSARCDKCAECHCMTPPLRWCACLAGMTQCNGGGKTPHSLSYMSPCSNAHTCKLTEH